MHKYLIRSTQGAAFVVVMLALRGTTAEVALAFMVGISFDPASFWWFL